jgi:hypothetical protein
VGRADGGRGGGGRRGGLAAPSLALYRAQALQILVSLDPLPEGARDMLRYVMETGTKEEAVDATRALCGFRVVHIGAYPNQREARRIAQTMEPARGRVFFWVPRRDPEAG